MIVLIDVPRKGSEPPFSYQEADFKFTAVGSQGFVTVLMRTGTWSQINLLRYLGFVRTTLNLREPQT